jgi:hypothetical protein
MFHYQYFQLLVGFFLEFNDLKCPQIVGVKSYLSLTCIL